MIFGKNYNFLNSDFYGVILLSNLRFMRSMQMITNENPIGMLNSIGLRPRKIVQVANEQYEVPIGATFTRRIKTDVTVSVLNERRGRLYLK